MPPTSTTPSPLTPALTSTRQTLYHSIWTDLYPKLNLTSASNLFTSDLEIAETLLSWVKEEKYDPPWKITTFEYPPPTSSPTQKEAEKNVDIHFIPQGSEPTDDMFSHAFAHIDISASTSSYLTGQTKSQTPQDPILPILKQIFYTLQPKGIALITITKSNPVEEILQSFLSTSGGRRRSSSATSPTTTSSSITSSSLLSESSLRDLAESAGFELGKIRVSSTQEAELERLRKAVLEVLDKAMGMRGDGQSWEGGFDGVWEDAVHRHQSSGGHGVGGGKGRGIKMEYWVLVAKKWDLLCA